MNRERRFPKFLTMAIFAMLLFVSAAAHAQTLTMTLNSDSAGATLMGGLKAATLSMGTVTRSGGSVPVGVTKSTAASNWTLSTPFDVKVIKPMVIVSANYTLTAMLSVADAVHTWKIDSIALNSASASTINVNGTYAVMVSHTVSVTIPDNASAATFSNTITLMAVSN